MLVPHPFPLELWEEIIYSVDSSPDLLSLALVSKFFDFIIIPHHIQYRDICCDLRRAYVWTHLIDNRRRTRGIRRLKLVDEEEYLIELPPLLVHPDTFYTTDETIAVSSLVQSLLLMTTLNQFEWKSAPCNILNLVDISRLLVDKATNLRALSLSYVFPSDAEEISNFTQNINSLPIWELCNLSRVSLTYPCQSALEMIVQRCPNLEDLCLYAPSQESYCLSILERGNWPKLRRLYLLGRLVFIEQDESVTLEEQKTIASNFFRRHTGIQSLLLNVPFFPTFLFDFSFKLLRSISWRVSVTSNVTSLLSRLDLSRVLHYRTNTRDIDPLARMDSLETLHIKIGPTLPSDLKDFIQNAPNLKKLNLTGKAHSKSIISLISCLIQCSRLTHVYLSTLFHSSEVKKLPRRLSRIKTLKYIQVSIKHEDLFMKIDRNATNGYSGYHLVPYSKSIIGQPPSEWGDFFYDL